MGYAEALRLLGFLSILSVATPGHAYIDPNIGGQLSQILAPVLTLLLGAVAFARQWVFQTLARLRASMKAVFRRVFG